MADYPVTFTLEVKNSEEIKRKFEEPKKALEDLKKAADDVNKPLDDTSKSLGDLSKSAGDVDKDLDDTAKALDDVSKSASDISSDIDNVGSSFSDLAKSAGDVSSDLKDADSAFTDIASSADGSVSSMDAVTSSFDNISTAAQEAQTNIEAAANGIDGIGTSIGQAETALDGLGSAFDGAGTATTTFNDVLSSTGSQAQAASGGLTPLNTVLGQVGGATQQAQTGFQGFNSNLGIMTGFIGTAASGAVQFATALSNLHGAQIKVEATQAKLSAATEAEAKARAHLNELLASGSASTEEIEQATLDLTQAHEKNNIAIERAGKAQDDLNIKYAKFASDVLPGVIQSITSTVAVASQLHDKFKDTETSGLINFFTEGETGAKGFASALGVLALAAGTAWAAFELYKQLPSLFGAAHAEFEGDLDGVIKSLEEYRDVIKTNPLMEPIFGQRLEEHIADLKLQRQGVDDNTNALRQYGPTLESGGALLDKFGESQDKSAIKARQQTEILEAQKPVIQALADDITKFLQEHNLFGQTLEDTSQVTATLTSRFGEMRDATDSFGEGFFDARQNVEEAKGTLDGFIQSVQGQIEAADTLKVKLHEQNEEMSNNIQQTQELVGSSENYNQSLLTIGQSIADHNVKIDQLNASLNTAEGQQLSFANAVAAGDEQFLQWVQTTRDAATQAETFKGHLEAMANTFGGLPGFMEGTVEEYQAFIRANTEGGDAVEAFSDMALESWRSLVSAAEPLFNDLKSAWEDIFSGETLQTATDAIAAANDQIAQNIQDNEEAIATSAEGTAPKIKDIFDGVDWQSITDAMADPFAAAFDKLPPMVSATLDETERNALTFQAKFATIAENAGTTFAENLQANMGEGFDQALAKANQAVADMLAPFIAEHPEMAQMFQPLFDAMNQTGPGAGQAVQDVLTELSGMPGPMGDVAREMLANYETEFAGKLPGVTKTGVEGALTDLTQIMSEGMNTIVEKLNTLINTGIKQDPASVPEITANTNPANEAIQLIATSLDQLQTYLEENPLKISVATTGGEAGVEGAGVATNPATGVITSIFTAYQQLQTSLTESPLTITLNAEAATTAIDELNTKIDAMAGKNVTITVNIGPAGAAITQLQGQIDAVHGKDVTITVNIGPAGAAITQLQGQIDAVHGKEVSITVDTGAAGTAIREIQGQIDNVHGTNVYITVDTSGAQAAIAQLQQQINSLQSSMGGAGGGYAPGYQSPYGSYQGAYGAPYAKGFGPAVVDRPTRMLVGEAGPEMVSVIPMKGNNAWWPGAPVSKTAATGMGAGYRLPGFEGMDDAAYERAVLGYRDTTQKERDQYLASQKGSLQGSQQGSQQGTAAGINQTAGRMGEAVQQGFDQGMPGMQQAVQQGAQQGVQDGMQQAGAGGGGGGYPQAPSNTEIFGAGRFTWGGGAAGTQLGAPGGGGAQYPMAPSNTELFGTGTRFTWMGGASGTQLGAGVRGGGGGGGGSSSFGGGMMPIPPNFWTGTSGGAGRGGGGAGGAPGVYTGQVPANYGQPLGQSINGIKATILPGQGPIRQAALGMHERLRQDTVIQAHKNEYVDIGNKPGDHPGRSSGLDGAAMGKITQLLERLLSQGSTFKVDFNVDGRKLSSVAAKNMGTAGYGDK